MGAVEVWTDCKHRTNHRRLKLLTQEEDHERRHYFALGCPLVHSILWTDIISYFISLFPVAIGFRRGVFLFSPI